MERPNLKKLQESTVWIKGRLCFDFDYIIMLLVGIMIGFALGFYVGVDVNGRITFAWYIFYYDCLVFRKETK